MSGIKVHHLGLASTNYEGTVDFYTRVLGWPIAWQDQHLDPESGKEHVRHVFFNAGDGLYVAFVCSVPGSNVLPEKWATDINSGLGLPTGIYHFAFSLESEEDLKARAKEMTDRGAEVSSIVDHGWCKSIYFRDPVNDLMLEFAVPARAFTDDDKLLKPREQPGIDEAHPTLEEVKRTAAIMGLPAEAFPQFHALR